MPVFLAGIATCAYPVPISRRSPAHGMQSVWAGLSSKLCHRGVFCCPPHRNRCMDVSDGSPAAGGREAGLEVGRFGDLRDHFVHQVQKNAHPTRRQSRGGGGGLCPCFFRSQGLRVLVVVPPVHCNKCLHPILYPVHSLFGRPLHQDIFVWLRPRSTKAPARLPRPTPLLVAPPLLCSVL